MTLLITGARVIDATGERTGDIRITDGSISEVGDALTPGADDQVVDAAVTLCDVLEDACAVFSVVGLACNRARALAERRNGRVEGLLLAAGDDDGSALINQTLGDAQPNSATASSN